MWGFVVVFAVAVFIGLGVARWWALLFPFLFGLWLATSLNQGHEVNGWAVGGVYGAVAAVGVVGGVLIRGAVGGPRPARSRSHPLSSADFLERPEAPVPGATGDDHPAAGRAAAISFAATVTKVRRLAGKAGFGRSEAERIEEWPEEDPALWDKTTRRAYRREHGHNPEHR